MDQTNNYIVYQVYGHQAIFDEAVYSIASYWCNRSDLSVKIIIYTDDVNQLKTRLPVGICYELLDETTIEKWRGESNFVHRLKIELLIDCCEKYTGNLLYLDTDTRFTKSIEPLFKSIQNDGLLMHTCEGSIATKENVIFMKLYRFLKNRSFTINGEEISIPVSTLMWNAGMVGFHTKHKMLLNEVLALTDVLYMAYPKHIMEQLAFSYILNQETRLESGEEYIYHYWNFKEFRKVLRDFFDAHSTKSFDELLVLIPRLDPHQLSEAKREYETLPNWQKQWRKLLGQTWQMPDYQFWTK